MSADESIDWRGLFDSCRIPWRDRGKNTSRKNINVNCPWCRDDQGFHLGVKEGGTQYYCFRSPEHSGSNAVAMLVKCGIGRIEATRLLNEYRRARRTIIEAEPIPASAQQTAWDRFLPAAEAPQILDYIYSRGFPDPEAVARRYDIRYTPHGKWAWRMLLPIIVGGQLRSWTGRGIRPTAIPKYLTQESGVEGLIYAPRPARDTVVITEGPLDALKLAAAGEALPISALALTGKQFNNQRAWNVLQYCKDAASRVLLCLDADTSLAESSRMLAELRGALPRLDVRRIKLPPGQKDAGGMDLDQAADWLSEIV